MCQARPGRRCSDRDGSGQAASRPPDSDAYNGQGRSDEEYDRIAKEYAATDDDKTYEVVTAGGSRFVAQGINSAKTLAGKDGTFTAKKDQPKPAPSMAEQASRDRQARREALVNGAADRMTAEAAGDRELSPGELQNQRIQRSFESLHRAAEDSKNRAREQAKKDGTYNGTW